MQANRQKVKRFLNSANKRIMKHLSLLQKQLKNKTAKSHEQYSNINFPGPLDFKQGNQFPSFKPGQSADGVWMHIAPLRSRGSFASVFLVLFGVPCFGGVFFNIIVYIIIINYYHYNHHYELLIIIIITNH